jgi:hypothetical protein
MKIGFTTAGLRQASWREYLVRLLFGGGLTALTSVIAQRYGPAVGGLFLAFPAILPASLTLLARHQRDRKARQRLNGTIRGGQAAALDALGAFLGSAGLFVFAPHVAIASTVPACIRAGRGDGMLDGNGLSHVEAAKTMRSGVVGWLVAAPCSGDFEMEGE